MAIGVIYLLGMVVGIGGNIVIQSILGASDPLASVGANSMLVAIGTMLWLLAVAGDAAHGILMLPVLRRFSERIAFGYFGARIMAPSSWELWRCSSLFKSRSRTSI